MKELELLRNVYRTGLALRNTAPVDDDFPEMMQAFDMALMAAKKGLPKDKPEQTYMELPPGMKR